MSENSNSADESTPEKVTKSSHPKFSVMVNNALKQMNDRKGSSAQAIKKYVSLTYNIEEQRVAPGIKKYLKVAVDNGSIIQTSGKGANGSFKLGSTLKAEKGKVNSKKKILDKTKKKRNDGKDLDASRSNESSPEAPKVKQKSFRIVREEKKKTISKKDYVEGSSGEIIMTAKSKKGEEHGVGEKSKTKKLFGPADEVKAKPIKTKNSESVLRDKAKPTKKGAESIPAEKVKPAKAKATKHVTKRDKMHEQFEKSAD